MEEATQQTTESRPTMNTAPTTTKPRSYREWYSVCIAKPDGTPNFDEGSGGGGPLHLRYESEWLDANSIHRAADQSREWMRADLTRTIRREQARFDALGPVRRRLPKSQPRPIFITAGIELTENGDGDGYRSSIEIGFDPYHQYSVAWALQDYRRFVVEELTRIVDVEKDLARESSAGFWDEWVGA